MFKTKVVPTYGTVQYVPVSVADLDPDPGSCAFLNPGSGMGKMSGSGSGMNNQDSISASLHSFMKIRIREKHPGSATLVQVRTGLLQTRFNVS
jgi:hypothetical protein